MPFQKYICKSSQNYKHLNTQFLKELSTSLKQKINNHYEPKQWKSKFVKWQTILRVLDLHLNETIKEDNMNILIKLNMRKQHNYLQKFMSRAICFFIRHHVCDLNKFLVRSYLNRINSNYVVLRKF